MNKLIVIVIIVAWTVTVIGSTSNLFAVPPDSNFGESSGTCETSNDGLTTTCCWREKIPGSLLGESYCQTCKRTVTNNGITINCSDKELQMDFVKTPESARPSNNDQVLENQQTKQPSTKSDENIILEEGIVEHELQQNPSFNGEKETGLEFSESENPPLSSGTVSPEQTTSFSKKGNNQNSPTPPECPKQGPIPPDCTMKPKF